MTEHAYDVARAVLRPDGPQECCCNWWTANLLEMKRHLLDPQRGHVAWTPPVVVPKPIRFGCRVEDCLKVHHALGYCIQHYYAHRRVKAAA